MVITHDGLPGIVFFSLKLLLANISLKMLEEKKSFKVTKVTTHQSAYLGGEDLTIFLSERNEKKLLNIFSGRRFCKRGKFAECKCWRREVYYFLFLKEI